VEGQSVARVFAANQGPLRGVLVNAMQTRHGFRKELQRAVS
jgi:hypothetical protein